MQDKNIEMDLNDILIIKQNMAEIEHIGLKYDLDLPANKIIEKVKNIEKVKV